MDAARGRTKLPSGRPDDRRRAAVPAEDLSPAVMLIVISQLAVAYLIEVFGLFGVDKQPFLWRRVIGMAVCIGGIILFKWES